MYERGQQVPVGGLNAPYNQTSAPAPVDESASAIRDAVTHAEALLSELHEAISALDRRLETVLTPAPPQTATNSPSKTGSVGSHLRGRVLILNEGWQHAVERISQLRQRVEV